MFIDHPDSVGHIQIISEHGYCRCVFMRTCQGLAYESGNCTLSLADETAIQETAVPAGIIMGLGKV